MKKLGCKPAYRKQYLALRDALSSSVQASKSAKMSDRLMQLEEYRQANTIHAFISFGSEIDTRLIIENAWANNKQVVCPVTDTKNKCLTHHQVFGWNDFTTGYAGILEPKAGCPEIELAKLELILIPGMAFDAFGFRMGYGGGYYDRFLPQTNAVCIAPAFESQIIERVPHCMHDQQIDLLVSDKRVIRCNTSVRPECHVKKLKPLDCPEVKAHI